MQRRRASSTTSDAARRRGSARPSGLRRQGPRAGVAPPRRTAARLVRRRRRALALVPWRSQRGHVGISLGALSTSEGCARLGTQASEITLDRVARTVQGPRSLRKGASLPASLQKSLEPLRAQPVVWWWRQCHTSRFVGTPSPSP